MVTRRNVSGRDNRMPLARGGVSIWSVVTGVVGTLGAFVLLSAIAAGILAATGTSTEDISRGDLAEAGIVGAIVLGIAWFLSALWGGYTAGRMARGAGWLNGLLVPVVAIILLLIAGGIAAALGADELNLQNPLPISPDNAADYGIPIGIATLVAIFLGAILGGLLGSNWHNKLERRAGEDVVGDHERRDEDMSGGSDYVRGRADADFERPRDQGPEPVVTRHDTDDDRQEQKPSIKDRLTGH